jgi:hypothetical protein
MFTKEILKWLTAIGLGAATAALAWAKAHLGSGPSVAPLLAGVIVGALSKVINWLTSKVPAAPSQT